MKRILCLVVCSCLNFAALGAGGMHDINGAFVTSVAVDTLKSSATASLFIYEDPSMPAKPRALSGDGPMPISPARHPGEHSLALDLKKDNERRVYQILLAARAANSSVDVSFAKTGEVSGISVYGGHFMPVAMAEGHLNIGDMKNVKVDAIHYCLVKNAILIELHSKDDGVACATSRCSTPALSLSLDPTNAGDAQSFEALLSAYSDASFADLGFDSKGELTNVTLHSGYANTVIVRPTR